MLSKFRFYKKGRNVMKQFHGNAINETFVIRLLPNFTVDILQMILV